MSTSFVGPASGRGNAGSLVLRVDEFWWLVDRLTGVDRLSVVELSGAQVGR